MQPKGVAIRKRTQITMANQTMFLWVAGVSIILGFSIVGSMLLTQKLLFNNRVIATKDKTITTLKINNANIPELQAQIRILDTNQALIDVKAAPTDQAIQVILDALPSTANSLALGASIQNKLLNVPGVLLNTLQVDPVAGIELLSGDGSAFQDTSGSSMPNEITIRFNVEASASLMKKVLLNLESSIRTIDITKLKIEGTDQLTVNARAFYEPAKDVSLKKVTVK